MAMGLRRSVLYVPASNARAMAKAHALPADAIILDLEDAVAPESKPAARAAVCRALVELPAGGRERLVRLNGAATPWGPDDLTALAAAPADGLVLPKAEHVDEVAGAAVLLDEAGASHMPLWCMIETPLGVLQAASLAAHERVHGLIMGTSDLATALRIQPMPDRQPLLHSLGQVVLAARAAGIAVLDGVHLELDDKAGFAAACRQGRALGFDGKTLIHPRQIDAANRAFAPADDEIAWARRVTEAFEAARAKGEGLAILDGRLIENLHAAEARRVLDLARAIADRQARS